MYKNYIIKPLKDNTYEGVGFEGKPTKIKSYGYFSTLTLQELKNKRLYLILNPTRFFFENYTVTLPTYSPEIIRLKLQDRIINTIGYFQKPVNIYWKIIEQKGPQYKVAYLALESELVEREINKLKEIGETRLEIVTFLPFVLAQIISQEPGDKILIHQEREGLWIILMSNEYIYLIEFFPIDELLGLNTNEFHRRLAYLRTFYFRENQRNLQFLYLTKKNLLEAVKDLDLQVRIIEEEYPEFFNIFQVDSCYNFLPEEERAMKQVLESNYKFSYLIFLFSILLTFSATGLHFINRSIERDIQQKELLINESLKRLFSQYPEEKLRIFRSYLEEKIKLQQSPEPKWLLINIIQTFSGTRITNFEVKKEGEDYTLSLRGEKKISSQEVFSFTLELLKKVSTFITVTENRIDYLGNENKLVFEIKGIIRNL